MSILLRIFGEIFNRRKFGPPTARWCSEQCQECPICHHAARILDTLDFNTSCEGKAAGLSRSNVMVDYFYCEFCGFCFAPQFGRWDLSEFKSRIYNADYLKVDPDYTEKRPLGNSKMLEEIFGIHKTSISHLDYGSGDGALGTIIRSVGWNSVSYDPINDNLKSIESLGNYDLVTAFEVFEHVPIIERLMLDLSAIAREDGLILFSTLLSDGQIDPYRKLDWWYAAPRNGHVSLFSSASLKMLLNRHGYKLHSFSPAMHAAYITIPDWARAILPKQ